MTHAEGALGPGLGTRASVAVGFTWCPSRRHSPPPARPHPSAAAPLPPPPSRPAAVGSFRAQGILFASPSHTGGRYVHGPRELRLFGFQRSTPRRGNAPLVASLC